MSTSSRICTVEQAVEDIRNGKMVIVVDDENRENEGDFILAASHITQEKINFLLKYARGLICVPITRERQRFLNLYPMVEHNNTLHGTNFTVTVDHKDVTTGISVRDRYISIKALVDDETGPGDLLRPGHTHPLIGREGGVLVRAGHTEAAIDLARMAGLPPVGVICEILNDDGTMARLPDLKKVAAEHDMHILTIEDLIAYRKSNERLVRHVVTTRMPNEFGVWNLKLYENLLTGEEHVVLVMGEPERQDSALIRVHSKCLTGDTFGSQRCDCGPQLYAAMQAIADEGHGIIIYMDQEGRGIGLRGKLMAYNLQDEGQDTVQANESLGFQADLREYGIGAQILSDIGVKKLRVLTNNPRKIVGISGFGLEVIDRVSLPVVPTRHNYQYLATKVEKMGHLIEFDEDDPIVKEFQARKCHPHGQPDRDIKP